jgi:hypothetical protein
MFDHASERRLASTSCSSSMTELPGRCYHPSAAKPA